MEVEQISALSSGKNNKYEHLTEEEISKKSDDRTI